MNGTQNYDCFLVYCFQKIHIFTCAYIQINVNILTKLPSKIKKINYFPSKKFSYSNIF